ERMEFFPESLASREGQQQFWDIVDIEAPDATKRMYYVDEEELYEKGALRFLNEFSPVLISCGLSLPVISEKASKDTYVLETSTEHFDFSAVATSDNPWTDFAVKTYEVVNTILLGVTDERLYHRYGGNDGQIILLTVPQ